MNEESVLVVASDHLTQLLQCPGSAWMSRDVVVDHPTAAMLNDHKHIQQTEGRGHGHEEIAGNNPLSEQAQESRPAQVASRPTSRTPGKILILVHGSGEAPESRASTTTRWRSFPRPMRDSHSRSDELVLVTQVEWAAGQAETSSSRTVSILLGASESTSRDLR